MVRLELRISLRGPHGGRVRQRWRSSGKTAALILGIERLLETKDFESLTLQFTATHCGFWISDLGVRHGR
jgi:hypothetical protein